MFSFTQENMRKLEIDVKLNLTLFAREQNTIHVQFPSDYSDVKAFLPSFPVFF